MAADESPIRERGPITETDALELLNCSEVEILGRMPYSSNGTFLVDLKHGDDVPAQAIYKPHRTERPLFDFPDGLYRREVATYALSRQLGWDLVPPTVMRADGPLGVGSLQLFIPTDYDEHYFTLIETGSHTDSLQQICLLDMVANSTDRKGGHCLVDLEGRVWAIDNGLTFHHEFKLRTVVWEWAGEPVPAAMLDRLVDFLDTGLDDDLTKLLDGLERDAVATRTRAVIAAGTFPTDPTGRRYPWPLL